jgi:hypothetical protein
MLMHILENLRGIVSEGEHRDLVADAESCEDLNTWRDAVKRRIGTDVYVAIIEAFDMTRCNGPLKVAKGKRIRRQIDVGLLPVEDVRSEMRSITNIFEDIVDVKRERADLDAR